MVCYVYLYFIFQHNGMYKFKTPWRLLINFLVDKGSCDVSTSVNTGTIKQIIWYCKDEIGGSD